MSKQIEEVMNLVTSATCAGIDYGAAEDGVIARNCLAALHKAEAEVEAKLRELLPVWQPIESAPKDGSFGIYWSKNHGANVWNRPEGCAGGIWKIVDGRLCGHACHGFDEATHWMPIPKDPE